jgi:hypothetical protein
MKADPGNIIYGSPNPYDLLLLPGPLQQLAAAIIITTTPPIFKNVPVIIEAQ